MEVESTMMSSQLNMKLDFRVRVVDSDGVGLFTESLDVWGGGGGSWFNIFYQKINIEKGNNTASTPYSN